MGDIVRVEVLSVVDGSLEYRDTVSRRLGRAGDGGFGFEVGAEVVIELETSGNRQVVVRILNAVQPLPEGEVRPVATADEPVLLINGISIERDAHIEVAQVRTAEIAFSSFKTAERDRGRTGKRRPCVIVAMDGDHISVCPIYGSHSVVRRVRRRRRLEGGEALGLRKSSFVDPESVWVGREDVGEWMGDLGPTDRRNLGLPPEK